MAARGVWLMGVGMISPAGLGAPEVAASIRAGTMRFVETHLPGADLPPFAWAEVPEAGLPSGPDGRDARLARLAEPALRECLAYLPAGAAPPPLVIALPETADPLDDGGLLDALAARGGGFDRARSEAFHRGRSGGLRAIARAADLLASGFPAVVAGGVDTYRDTGVLRALAMDGRLRCEHAHDGFIPGEGAGFLLLGHEGAAAPLAAISGFAAGVEPGHLYSDEPYRGDGLAAVFAASLASAPEPVGEVYSSMNGESHWAREWGVAALRGGARLADGYRLHHPADCHGDTGAAAGPIMVALAALGMAGGYRRSPCLVYASSDRGERAAVVVHSR